MANVTDQYAKFGECCLKQVKAINELNAKTLVQMTKNSNVEEILGARDMSDIVEAQGRLVKGMQAAVINYTQELYNILLTSSTDVTKHFTNIAGEFGQMAETVTRTATTATSGKKSS